MIKVSKSKTKPAGPRAFWGVILPVLAAAAVMAAVLSLTGCMAKTQRPLNVIKGEPKADQAAAEEQGTAKKKTGKVVWVQQPLEGESVIGTGAGKGPNYLMNFENIAIPEFIEAMMSGVFKQNYLITEKAKAMGMRFTIKMTEDLEPERAFQLFKGILALYNVSVSKKENTYIFDQALKEGGTITLKGPMIYGRQVPEKFPMNPDDEVTFVVPFYNITPESLKGIIEAQVAPQSMVLPVPELNLLVINGNYEDIRYTLALVDLLDRAQFKDKTILMITPEYWDIKEFEEKVQELLEAEGISMNAVERTKGIMFIRVEKLNSLVVISPVREWAERVLYWLEKLDIPEAAGEAKKVYTYRLKNVDVASATEVLLSYQTGTMPSMSSSRSSRTAGRKTQRAGTKEVVDEKNPANPQATPTDQARRSLKPGITGIEGLTEEVSIIPVAESNTLVMVATPVEYKKFMDIIQRIDIPRNQVFVEVIIGEVSLDRGSQMGLEFWVNRYLHRTSFGTKGGLGVYQGTDTGGNTVIPPGSNFFLKGTLTGTQFEVLLNALVEESKINIISTPKITVLENEDAEISVGSDVPVISGESVYGGGATDGNYVPFRSIQYITTGIILKVRAAILTDNKISLEIEQEISEAMENKKSDISSPEILKRSVKTTMVVNEGEIAFIGGLFQNKITTTSSGIPVISKIPLLGSLFKNAKKQFKKTELVVFINSKTVRRQNDMKDIVDGIRKMYTDKIYVDKEKSK